jgi:hypothetical protein
VFHNLIIVRYILKLQFLIAEEYLVLYFNLNFATIFLYFVSFTYNVYSCMSQLRPVYILPTYVIFNTDNLFKTLIILTHTHTQTIPYIFSCNTYIFIQNKLLRLLNVLKSRHTMCLVKSNEHTSTLLFSLELNNLQRNLFPCPIAYLLSHCKNKI